MSSNVGGGRVGSAAMVVVSSRVVGAGSSLVVGGGAGIGVRG